MKPIDHTPYKALIEKARDARLPFYLLVDPRKSVWDDYSISLVSLRKTFGEDRVVPIPRADLLHVPHQCPHLIELAGPQTSLDEESVQKAFSFSVMYALNSEHPGAMPRYVCGWLQSDADILTLAQRMADAMLFSKSGSTLVSSKMPIEISAQTTVVYPIHQPLRQELLAYASYDKTHPDWLHTGWLAKLAQHWFIPTTDRALMHFDATAPHEGASAELPPLALGAMIDAPAISDLLMVWSEHSRDYPSRPQQLRQQTPLLQLMGGDPLPKGAAMTAFEQLRAARRRGIVNCHDQITFAIFRIISHPRFDQHPVISRMIDASIAGGKSFTDQIAGIAYPQWMQILRELDAS